MEPGLFNILLLIPSLCVASTCLTNIEVVELPGFLHSNTTSVRASWDNECQEDKVVKLIVRHMQYLSCEEGRRDYSDREVVVTGNLVIVENLQPFSSYGISLATGGDLDSVAIATRAGVPQLIARKSMIDYSIKDTDTALYFNWGPPATASQCDKYQSIPGFYYYTVRGLDRWTSDYIASGEVPYNQTGVHLTSLHPASTYVLFVYITNSAGQYSRDKFLKLTKKTAPGPPLSPYDLKVCRMKEDYHHLSWAQPYPPTGVIAQYNVRWRNNHTKKTFLGSKTVLPSNILCEENIEMKNNQTNQVCVTLTELDRKIGYFFSVQAINKGVDEGSPWSIEVYLEPDNSSFELASSGTLAIILVLSTLVLVVLIGVLRTAYKVRNKLQFKQNMKHYFQETPDPAESIRSDTTMVTYMSQIIPAETEPETHYATVGRRKLSATPSQRSQQDPLPPVPPPVLDIPGYIRPNFHRPDRLGSSSEDEDPPADLPVENYIAMQPTIHL